jgi:hypothetical protein
MLWRRPLTVDIGGISTMGIQHMRRSVLLLIALTMVAAGCSSSGDTSSDAVDVTVASLVPESVDRCEEVDPLVLDYLTTGIVVDGITLPWGYAVKSGDFPDVWMVAAAVENDTDIDYGTWAIRAGTWPTDYIGAVAVDEIAHRVSDWGEGLDVEITPAVDGVRSAGACAIARLDG